jgi:hypothetical protein
VHCYMYVAFLAVYGLILACESAIVQEF